MKLLCLLCAALFLSACAVKTAPTVVSGSGNPGIAAGTPAHGYTK